MLLCKNVRSEVCKWTKKSMLRISGTTTASRISQSSDLQPRQGKLVSCNAEVITEGTVTK